MKTFHVRLGAFALLVLFTAVAGQGQQPAVVPAFNPQPDGNPVAVTTTGGTSGLVPVFTGASTIGNSILYASSTALGIGLAPSTYGVLDVGGQSIFRGGLNLARTGNASASSGTNSNPFLFSFQFYNSAAKFVYNPYFSFQAEATGNNTANPAGTMNLLYYNGIGGVPKETGLYFNTNGNIHFAPSQTFPIAAGPQGPQGPAGPTGATGPQGPVGATGPAGTLSFPYFGEATTYSYMLNLSNDGDGGGGYFKSATIGDGLTAFGGTSGTGAYSSGGNGITAQGGEGAGAENYGGTGGIFIGGYSQPSGFQAGDGVVAYGGNAYNSGEGGFGIYAAPGGNGNYAGYFDGSVNVNGNLSKSGGSFRIDDPEDPANKYLSHSFVESPDMMNIYNGNAVTDATGTAVVTMPTYFESLNRDFRYQLTILGQQFAQALVASEIANGAFTIKTDKPNIKVSWQVTGVRQDAWANAHRIPVEEEKAEADKGKYLHPELFGRPNDRNIEESHRPNLQQQKRVAPVDMSKQ